MFSCIEDLSIELWLEIFSYLKLNHQFKAFYNLNKRLNRILFSYRNHISYYNNDVDSEYLFIHLLPFLQQREQIISLRLEKTKKMEIFYNIDLLYLPCLTALTFHRMEITLNIVKIIEHSSAHLRYVYISQVISGNKQTLHRLFETIISLPNLQTCRLRLGIVTSHFPLTISSKSPMKDLRLIGKNENCSIDRLINLITYLPYLKSLDILANQLNLTSISSIINVNKSSISNFILHLNQSNISLLELTDFILKMTPKVEELKLIFRSPIENHSYLDYLIWLKFIKSLSYLQKLTLVIQRHRTFDEQIWNRNCQILTNKIVQQRINFKIDQT